MQESEPAGYVPAIDRGTELNPRLQNIGPAGGMANHQPYFLTRVMMRMVTQTTMTMSSIMFPVIISGSLFEQSEQRPGDPDAANDQADQKGHSGVFPARGQCGAFQLVDPVA